jgi:hypothetical protein
VLLWHETRLCEIMYAVVDNIEILSSSNIVQFERSFGAIRARLERGLEKERLLILAMISDANERNDGAYLASILGEVNL